MFATISLIVGVALTAYEGVVRIFPSIDIKYSIIGKLLNLLQVISNAMNNK